MRFAWLLELTHKIIYDEKLADRIRERIMVRLDPAKTDEVMEMDDFSQMDFAGKVMKG